MAAPSRRRPSTIWSSPGHDRRSHAAGRSRKIGIRPRRRIPTALAYRFENNDFAATLVVERTEPVDHGSDLFVFQAPARQCRRLIMS